MVKCLQIKYGRLDFVYCFERVELLSIAELFEEDVLWQTAKKPKEVMGVIRKNIDEAEYGNPWSKTGMFEGYADEDKFRIEEKRASRLRLHSVYLDGSVEPDAEGSKVAVAMRPKQPSLDKHIKVSAVALAIFLGTLGYMYPEKPEWYMSFAFVYCFSGNIYLWINRKRKANETLEKLRQMLGAKVVKVKKI